MGVANERSIAWGIAQKLSEHGAELAFTYVGDALKKRVVPLAESLGSTFTLDCNVENKDQIVQTFADIKKNGVILILLSMQLLFQIKQNCQVNI
jgi:Enoyl-[acyl-carrier-protein] reductase (NADH)